jgi:Arylsulfotransferase (ASST)
MGSRWLKAGIAIAWLAGWPALGSAVLEITRQSIEGIPVEIRRDTQLPSDGKYLIILNDVPRVETLAPPYRAIAMSLDTRGHVEIFRQFRSPATQLWVMDLKPQPDGTYTYGVNRPRPSVWVYDLHAFDPVTRVEIIDPKGTPQREIALDGHETMVQRGDRRFFLFYRARQEADRSYIDMEVAAYSATTGERVGFWTSKGFFPAEMTGDYLHFNSLSPMADDKVLASARSTSTLYVINLATGRIEDTIEAKTWRFAGDSKAPFARQHFAHFRDNGNLMLYDNRDGSEPGANSRAVEYAVDWKERTLTLVWERAADAVMPFRYGWGSVAAIGADEVLIGWGDYPRTKDYCEANKEMAPVFSHVRRDGSTLFEMRAPCGWATYRVYFVPR